MDLLDNLSNTSSLGIAFDQHYRQTFIGEFSESTTLPINISQVGQIVQDAYQYQVLTQKIQQVSHSLDKSRGSGRTKKGVEKKIKKWSTQFKPLHKPPVNFSSHSLARVLHPEPKLIDANLKLTLSQVREQLNKLKEDLASIDDLRRISQERDETITRELTIKDEESTQEVIKDPETEDVSNGDSYDNDLDQLLLTINRLEELLLLKTEEHQASVILLENAEQLLDQIEQSLMH